MNRVPIRPPNQVELRNLQSLLSTGEPYEILGCEVSSSKKEITKHFRDLARKYHPDKNSNNDGGDMMTKINNAYSVLSDERLREIYDVYLYESIKYGEMEDGDTVDLDETHRTIATVLSLLFGVVSWPFSKIAIMVHSNDSIIKTRDVVRSIYKEKGIPGFFRGSGFLLASGVFEVIKEYTLNKILSPQKLPPLVNTIVDRTIRPLFKHPHSLIMDLLDIAPFRITLSTIIFNVILKQKEPSSIFVRDQPPKFQNFFYGATYTLILLAAKKGVKHLINKADDYCYNGYIRNPDNLFFRYSNFIMKNSFLHNFVYTFCMIPLEVIRSQYPRMLLNSYDSGESTTPYPINPVLIAINIYKLNGIWKFFNGFVPYYMANLLESFSNQLDAQEDTYEDSE
ncbi:hypothetical protein DICPUDRAFT_77012 [Dictyostelium purpureum]|uniref:J domain-containing protein n=1 Tax=Dictyostelium purpureum TaxID=5786 RepID=F0ZFC1_DICPU|nr:uncharacterized protein DICPUDRAFT_77012 [Dictyostelium purpureum]EGC37356.1 hypothetical protein DICPUDRAFT_77012 [Dictyostelium purpureum]|eukprot:XP_003286097.1 hypothetical protein DICPUDRAFT_77012 [Dictyostelium purpureum]